MIYYREIFFLSEVTKQDSTLIELKLIYIIKKLSTSNIQKPLVKLWFTFYHNLNKLKSILKPKYKHSKYN